MNDFYTWSAPFAFGVLTTMLVSTKWGTIFFYKTEQLLEGTR